MWRVVQIRLGVSTSIQCERIRHEKTRPELSRMIEQLRDGDVVVVTKYDRLSRSLQDLLSTVEGTKRSLWSRIRGS